MSRVYCDANIIVPLFVREALSDRIEAWISDPLLKPMLSDLVVLEFSSALSRLVRERRIDAEQAKTALVWFRAWRRPFGRPLAITRQVFTLARAVVEQAELGIRGPDALHLGLVQMTGLPFATFDARLRAAALALGLPLIALPPL